MRKIKRNNIILFLLFIIVLPCFSQKEVVLKSHPNGKPSIVAYYKEKGKTVEKVKEIGYYENGQREYEGSFKDGKEHGRWLYYYENGKKMYEEFYKNGMEEGTHSSWAPDGKLLKEELYEKGRLIQTIEY